MGSYLRVRFDQLPPSENRIRVHRWQGGEAYSAEALVYRRTFLDHVSRKYFQEIQAFLRAHRETSLYTLTVVYTLPSSAVLNKGWFSQTRDGKRKASSVYKRKDTGNMDKLLVDSLVLALGGASGAFDDSLCFGWNLVRRVGPEHGVELVLEEEPPGAYGVRLEDPWWDTRSTS